MEISKFDIQFRNLKCRFRICVTIYILKSLLRIFTPKTLWFVVNSNVNNDKNLSEYITLAIVANALYVILKQKQTNRRNCFQYN